MTEVEHHHSSCMFRDIRVHGMDEANIISALGRMRKYITHPFSTLAILFETKR